MERLYIIKRPQINAAFGLIFFLVQFENNFVN